MKIYIVKLGETLYHLAKKHGIEIAKLIAANPHILNPDEIQAGTKVKVPIPPKPMEPAEGTYTFKHIVKQGDTLWKLGKAWDIPLGDMVAANPQLKNPNVLLTGEVVFIPKKAPDVTNNADEHPFTPVIPADQGAAAMATEGASAHHPEQAPLQIPVWGSEAPGQHVGFPPQPHETPGLQAHAGAPSNSWSYEPLMPHMQSPQQLQTPPYPSQDLHGSFLAEPFAGVQDWGQQAVHPYAQANIPATEAFGQQPGYPSMQQQPGYPSMQQQPGYPSMQQQPEYQGMQQQPEYQGMQQQPEYQGMQQQPGYQGMQQQPEYQGMQQQPGNPSMQQKPEYPSMPQQPFEQYASPYGSYPYSVQQFPPNYHQQRSAAYPFSIQSNPFDCCSGPQIPSPYSYGGTYSAARALPYAAPLTEPFHTGIPAYPSADVHGQPSWEDELTIDQKEQGKDLKAEGREETVKAKSVSASGNDRRSRPLSQREQISSYLHSLHQNPTPLPRRQPNLPWINV